jgi:CRP-like cAMP-binding protein
MSPRRRATTVDLPKARRYQRLGENRLLEALPVRDRVRLLRVGRRVEFGVRQGIYRPGEPVRYALFPLSGVMSIVLQMRDGTSVEVATVGNEGLVGTEIVLGAERSTTHAFCQVAGECIRVARADLLREIERSRAVQALVNRYTQAYLNQVVQSTACNHLHSVKERTCRWLLMTHDRVGANRFPLTHEFLAQMLGVRRPTVTIVAGLLQAQGLIQYARGVVTIVDRRGLEEGSCECYGVVRQQFERLVA